VRSATSDRGSGCAPSAPGRLRCELDFLSAGAPVGNVTLVTSIGAAGTHTVTATAGFDAADPTPGDNGVTLTASTAPTSTPPVTPTPPQTRNARASSRRGTARADRLVGSAGVDVIFGLGGNDVILGLGGNDLLLGGPGNDTLTGGRGADILDGGTGNDTINARDGAADTIRCGPGKDRVTADRRDRIAAGCETVRRG
jgi:Ca2+-binding RTX toxin-like protein